MSDDPKLAEALKARRERTLESHEFSFDPAHTGSCGYWTHDACGVSFYGGGEAIHRPECPSANGYLGCTYNFGPRELQGAKDWAESHGSEDFPMPLGPLTLNIIREKFPELV